MNSVKNEPVIIGTLLVPVLVWLAARYGIDLTAEQASGLAAAVLAAGSGIARMRVRTKRTLPNPDAVKPATVGPPERGPTV